MLITYGQDEKIAITRLSYSVEADEWKVSLEGGLSRRSGSGSFVNAFHLAGEQLLMVRDQNILLLSKTFDL